MSLCKCNRKNKYRVIGLPDLSIIVKRGPLLGTGLKVGEWKVLSGIYLSIVRFNNITRTGYIDRRKYFREEWIMEYLFICYSKWSTCRKARKWLDENNIRYEERSIKEENPTERELDKWISKSDYPIKRFFNTSGKIYREQKLKDRLDDMTQEEKIKLLATDGMLVKRPILVGEDTVLVGFKESEWKEKLI